MPLVKKQDTQTISLSIKVPAELKTRIDNVTAKAEAAGLVFDLQSTLVRSIRTELTKAENALKQPQPT